MHVRNLHIATLLGCLLAAACSDNLTPASGNEGYFGESAVFECLPNLDGQLEASELPLVFDFDSEFLVSANANLSLEPDQGQGSMSVWDFSAELDGDEISTQRIGPLDSQWFASEFPDARFSLPLSRDGNSDLAFLGVFSLNEQALLLHGIVSREQSPSSGTTLLPYVRPVPVMQLPLRADSAWTVEALIEEGTLNGLPYSGTDLYEFSVERTGIAVLPLVTFDGVYELRSQVTSTANLGGATASVRQRSYYFECFGEIVRAVSQRNENQENFQELSEYRRLKL